ncbi:BA75_02215T0 [Komagataella pastoris]|uniref:BA75_02215T0 n=1 Tax=Komagataella pastoris TaxID=4922 RepID=A0A1B2JAI0_PICPA|nr:BA75_02215T0 [Komagataella pastoris]
MDAPNTDTIEQPPRDLDIALTSENKDIMVNLDEDLDDYDGDIQSVSLVKTTSFTQGTGNVTMTPVNGSTGAFKDLNSGSYNHLELEYDSFNGSLADNVKGLPAEGLALKTEEEDGETNDKENLDGVKKDNRITSEQVVDEEANIALEVKKNREIIEPKLQFRNLSSQFTATKIDSDRVESLGEQKLSNLQEKHEELVNQILKIERELEFVDGLLPSGSNYLNTPEGKQLAKLKVARDKLFDKCELLKKEKYELSIKINYKWKKIHGIDGSDKTEFWVRGVSN